ncbi:tungsten ABC transporter substrate-binding protein [Candidatus Bathyarchaeota archaeon A05DMB-4]|nr:tungsten ABC transporter substrate-binding protein [Candidatus Bathyarchaeota archaeon A05DMB-4]
MVIVLLVFVFVTVAIVGEYFLSRSRRLVLSTTTSTWDSGLLGYLLPIYEQRYDVKVDVLHVGTGQALQIAQGGDADLVLVHSKELELNFTSQGYGVHRIGVMYNDFIIIGPPSDLAGIRGLTNATEAFRRIKTAGDLGNVIFVSRADKSGTNLLELKIWSLLGLTPKNTTYSWYWEAKTGMGNVLRICNEKLGYALTDRATWLSFKNELPNLKVLVQNDSVLFNPYSVILVNPDRYPHRNHQDAVKFVKFLISVEGQTLIQDFKKEGETLFYPLARDVPKAVELGFENQQEELVWYDSHT